VRTAARLGAAILAVIVAHGPASATPAPVPESAATVLAKYADALDLVEAPKFLTFEYSVEQAGPRNLVQVHRVYRSGLTERDEILSVDGQPLPHPSIRIIRNRVDRYSISATAPRPRDYVFSFVGAHRVGSHFDYIFHTEPRASGPFAVTSVAIDGLRYLPAQIDFTTVAGNVRGAGRLTYGKFERYWMISEATATAKIDAKVARERIVWMHYEFPASLPRSTFTAPRPLPTATP
jgi:hypothetical protein